MLIVTLSRITVRWLYFPYFSFYYNRQVITIPRRIRYFLLIRSFSFVVLQVLLVLAIEYHTWYLFS